MNKFFLFFFIFLFLFSFTLVSAIGVSPPKQYVNFVSGGSATVDFTILNYGGVSGTNILMVAKDSPLAKYVTFSEKKFKMAGDEHTIQATINFPPYENLTVYGKQIVKIVASEVSEGPTSSSFSVVTAVEPWLIVQIPVPGNFAEIKSLELPNVKEGENSTLSFRVINRGTNPLVSVKADFVIKDFSGNLVDKYTFENINIPVGETKSFSTKFTSDKYKPGKYFTTLNFYFDDALRPVSKEGIFFVGTTDVLLLNYTSTLKEGKINKVKLTLQSLWGSDLKSIRASIIDFNNHSQPLPVIDLGPFEKRVVETYIDVPFLNESPFFLNLSERNNLTVNTFMTLQFPVDASNDVNKKIPLVFNIVHPVIVSDDKSSFNISSTTILFSLFILVLIVLIIFIFVLFFRKK